MFVWVTYILAILFAIIYSCISGHHSGCFFLLSELIFSKIPLTQVTGSDASRFHSSEGLISALLWGRQTFLTQNKRGTNHK